MGLSLLDILGGAASGYNTYESERKKNEQTGIDNQLRKASQIIDMVKSGYKPSATGGIAIPGQGNYEYTGEPITPYQQELLKINQQEANTKQQLVDMTGVLGKGTGSFSKKALSVFAKLKIAQGLGKEAFQKALKETYTEGLTAEEIAGVMDQLGINSPSTYVAPKTVKSAPIINLNTVFPEK